MIKLTQLLFQLNILLLINQSTSDIIHNDKRTTFKAFIYGYTFVKKSANQTLDRETSSRETNLQENNKNRNPLSLSFSSLSSSLSSESLSTSSSQISSNKNNEKNSFTLNQKNLPLPTYLQITQTPSTLPTKTFNNLYHKQETYLYLDNFNQKTGQFRQLVGHPSDKLKGDDYRAVRTYNEKSIFLNHFKPHDEHKYGNMYSNHGLGHSNQAILTYSEYDEVPAEKSDKGKSKPAGGPGPTYKYNPKTKVQFRNKIRTYAQMRILNDVHVYHNHYFQGCCVILFFLKK